MLSSFLKGSAPRLVARRRGISTLNVEYRADRIGLRLCLNVLLELFSAQQRRDAQEWHENRRTRESDLAREVTELTQRPSKLVIRISGHHDEGDASPFLTGR